MKIVEKLQQRLEQLTTAPTTPFDERVAKAKQAHTEHINILHAEEDRDNALNRIVRTVRLEALRIMQYVDRQEVYKLTVSTYPLHPHKNAEVIQALAKRLEDQSVVYGMNHGMTAGEVRSLVREVWDQVMKSKLATGPLQSLIEANKPYIPLDQRPPFNPSDDALRWLELAKAEYKHRVDWDWDPSRTKELFAEFVETVKFQASRGMGVTWSDGTKRNKLTGSDLIWLERQLNQLPLTA